MRTKIITLTLLMASCVCSLASERIINFEMLPVDVQMYSRAHFPAGDDAFRNAFITYDDEMPEIAYTIVFTSGDGLIFRENHELKSYSAKTTVVPWDVLTEPVSKTLGELYPQSVIKHFEVVYVTLTKKKFEITLLDGTELVFDEDGNLITE
ncbi:MAG: PepSY-like domain-containing protein [Paludibacteraceae bacterium]|nr:PepSY-like domain-containing protein [Paludibacteraceae bacterium]